ncbi:T9SS type A sorting domain-containing protein [Flavobacterium sp. TBRC 19031]|uniref:T9SS type A sorting domain-containing protein n=1 Tax=Flavobacterium mekongense TaxID=3379707 RepID=UPI00399C2FAD
MKTPLIFISYVVIFLHSSYLLSQNNQPIVVASGLPQGVTSFDFHNQDIYFTITNNQHIIGKVNSSNNNQMYEVINNNVYTPFGLTVNQDILYFSEVIPERISRINLNQTNLQTESLIVGFEGNGPKNLKVYDNNLYFSQFIMNINKVPLNNFNAQPQLVTTWLPHQFDFIKEGNFLYTTTFGNEMFSAVVKIDLTQPLGSQPEIIVEILEPVSLAKIGQYLFVSTNDHKIYRVNLNQLNLEPELFYQPNDEVSYLGGNIKAHNNELYFSYNEADFTTETISGKIMKFTENQLNNPDANFNIPVSLYPNPSSDYIEVRTNNEITINSIEVYDLLGRKCLNTTLINNKIDINQLIPGVYTLNMHTTDGLTISKKIVKK